MSEQEYALAGVTATGKNGWVRFDWQKDIQAIQAKYENTLVVLRNGRAYLLAGRNYGV